MKEQHKVARSMIGLPCPSAVSPFPVSCERNFTDFAVMQIQSMWVKKRRRRKTCYDRLVDGEVGISDRSGGKRGRASVNAATD